MKSFLPPVFRFPVILSIALLAPVFWLPSLGSASDPPQTLFREEFQTLENWDPLKFPKIDKMSEYMIENGNGEASYLMASSEGSASGLMWKRHFNPYEHPRIRWRWRVDRVYRKGDATMKSGDDYPVRLYVMFQYNTDDPAVRPSLKYSLAKILYGDYPPYRSVNYIWANRDHGRRIIPNAYTKNSMMVLKETGAGRVGQWVTEEANILDDYREAFGEDPPRNVSLAVMNDSDDTGESSRSWIDFIEVFRTPEDPPEPRDEDKKLKRRKGKTEDPEDRVEE